MARRIEARRKELHLSIADLLAATGLSTQGLKNIRKGEIREYQDRTTLPLTRALGWSPDSIDRLLDGDEPIEVEAPLARTDTVTRSEFEALAAEVAGLQREILAAQQVTRSRVPLYDRLLDVEWPELVERVEQLEAGGDGRRANAGL